MVVDIVGLSVGIGVRLINLIVMIVNNTDRNNGKMMEAFGGIMECSKMVNVRF